MTCMGSTGTEQAHYIGRKTEDLDALFFLQCEKSQVCLSNLRSITKTPLPARTMATLCDITLTFLSMNDNDCHL